MVTSKTSRSSSRHTRRGESSFSSRFPSQLTDGHTSKPLQAPVPVEIDSAQIDGGVNALSQANKLLTESGLPDTGLADRLLQSQSIGLGLPPIPSQCFLPSDISSGGHIGNSQSFQSFPKVNCCPLFERPSGECAAQPNRPGQTVMIPSHHFTYDEQFLSGLGVAESFVQSATEVITPRSNRSPDPGQEHALDYRVASVHTAVDTVAPTDNQGQRNPSQLIEVDQPSGQSPANSTAVVIRPITDTKDSESTGVNENQSLQVRQIQALLEHFSAQPTLSTRMQNHEQRIDLLENVACSYASAQEVHEGFDLVDERIGEVEGRVEELEKAQAAMNDFSGVRSFRRLQRCLDDGDSSMVSQTSSEFISAAIERTEIAARLDTLETQFTDLQSSTLPSRANPWKVEVVFLPFGTSLKGVWSTLDQFSSQRSRNNSMAADNRAQSQFSNKVGTHALLNSPQTGQQRWEDIHLRPEENHEWLVARACGQGSKVEERLRSRGLVKMIEVMGPGARDVQAAMLAAFRDVSEVFHTASISADHQLPDSFGRFYGLEASWIPLRKLHKDSRLRFLDPSEMVTPALWTTSFLSSSVVMRATGVKRLYVTQRESYLQRTEAASTDWTWQKLRVLPRVFPDADSSTEVREANAQESCWEWDGRLDPPESAHSSFVSQHSPLSIRRAPSQHSRSSRSEHSFSSVVSPVLSTTPTSVIHTRNMSPVMERTRPLHSRTTSMPSIVPLKISPPPGKRRIASFDHELHGAGSLQSSPVRPIAGLGMKRRRISRSPSRPRDTPRWSVGPPSPYCFEETVEQKREPTPFAYATPHSNAPYRDFRPHSVAGMALDDHEEHGSITDDFGPDGEDHDVDELESEADQERQPEDDVWEGVGDEMGDEESDQERKALSVDKESDDGMSDLSSQPSEYPSTQPSAFYKANKGSFQIHVDDDEKLDTYDHPRRS